MRNTEDFRLKRQWFNSLIEREKSKLTEVSSMLGDYYGNGRDQFLGMKLTQRMDELLIEAQKANCFEECAQFLFSLERVYLIKEVSA